MVLGHNLGVVILCVFLAHRSLQYTQTLEGMMEKYEDELNSMIAITEEGDSKFYEDFYDEMDPRTKNENSMNTIFFGTTTSFMRLDSETLIQILSSVNTRLIPRSRILLIWDILTGFKPLTYFKSADGKTAAFLQSREFLALGSLLNHVPEEDLYYVNFGESNVLNYFATHDMGLTTRKYGILAASFKRYFGDEWFENSALINNMGYLLCGFPSYILAKITPVIITKIDVDIFRKLITCSANQTKTIYNLATHEEAYGQPYKWSSYEITKLDILLACIPKKLISSLRLEAIPSIGSNVIKILSREQLESFTKQQVSSMTPQTRRLYLIRVKLVNSLESGQIAQLKNCSMEKNSVLLILVCIVTLLLK